jgi:DNA-binding NtrC family response regulator
MTELLGIIRDSLKKRLSTVLSEYEIELISVELYHIFLQEIIKQISITKMSIALDDAVFGHKLDTVIETCIRTTIAKVKDRKKSAEMLGLPERTLYRRLNEMGIKAHEK